MAAHLSPLHRFSFAPAPCGLLAPDYQTGFLVSAPSQIISVCAEAQAGLVPTALLSALPRAEVAPGGLQGCEGRRLPSRRVSILEQQEGQVGPLLELPGEAPVRLQGSESGTPGRQALCTARCPWEQPGWPGGGAGVGASSDSSLGGGTPLSPAPTSAAFEPSPGGGAQGLQVGACGLNWPRAPSPLPLVCASHSHTHTPRTQH